MRTIPIFKEDRKDASTTATSWEMECAGTLARVSLILQRTGGGQRLKKRCKLWAPTWQKEMGWAPEAG